MKWQFSAATTMGDHSDGKLQVTLCFVVVLDLVAVVVDGEFFDNRRHGYPWYYTAVGVVW